MNQNEQNLQTIISRFSICNVFPNHEIIHFVNVLYLVDGIFPWAMPIENHDIEILKAVWNIYMRERLVKKCLWSYLNFEKIFLVGIDLDYKFPSKVKKVGKNKFITIGEDRNHFSPKYNSNKPWYLPNIERMKFSIELACNELIRKDVKVYNISNISNFKNVENIDNKYIEKFIAND